jgi:hypothetical protein
MKQQKLHPHRLIQAVRLAQRRPVGPGHVRRCEKIGRVAGDPQQGENHQRGDPDGDEALAEAFG